VSHILSTDLNDVLLQPLAFQYINNVEEWIFEEALAAGVASSAILVTLGPRAKRAAVLRLAVCICLGEMGQNQHMVGANGQDVFSIKLKAYQNELDKVLMKITPSDWSGDTVTHPDSVTPNQLCAEMFRG
jgi:hypothetical protein